MGLSHLSGDVKRLMSLVTKYDQVRAVHCVLSSQCILCQLGATRGNSLLLHPVLVAMGLTDSYGSSSEVPVAFPDLTLSRNCLHLHPFVGQHLPAAAVCSMS